MFGKRVEYIHNKMTKTRKALTAETNTFISLTKKNDKLYYIHYILFVAITFRKKTACLGKTQTQVKNIYCYMKKTHCYNAKHYVANWLMTRWMKTRNIYIAMVTTMQEFTTWMCLVKACSFKLTFNARQLWHVEWAGYCKATPDRLNEVCDAKQIYCSNGQLAVQTVTTLTCWKVIWTNFITHTMFLFPTTV